MEHGTALSLPGIGVMYGHFSRPNPIQRDKFYGCFV